MLSQFGAYVCMNLAIVIPGHHHSLHQQILHQKLARQSTVFCLLCVTNNTEKKKVSVVFLFVLIMNLISFDPQTNTIYLLGCLYRHLASGIQCCPSSAEKGAGGGESIFFLRMYLWLSLNTLHAR